MGAAGGDRAAFEVDCPECGRHFSARTLRGANGALRMHRCEVRVRVREQHLEDSGGTTGPAPRTCDHAWRLLSSGEHREAQALSAGYVVLCEDCGMVERAASLEVG